MKKKSAKSLILVSLLMIFGIGLGWVINYALNGSSHAASARAEQPYELVGTPQNLQYLGLDFSTPTPNDGSVSSAIDQAKAYSVAIETNPGLKIASNYSARIGYLSSKVNLSLSKPTLVWLITFQGILTSSSGQPGGKHYISNEYTVVIDAVQGKYIMAFPLYDVTPVPENTIQSPDMNSGPTSAPQDEFKPLPTAVK